MPAASAPVITYVCRRRCVRAISTRRLAWVHVKPYVTVSSAPLTQASRGSRAALRSAALCFARAASQVVAALPVMLRLRLTPNPTLNTDASPAALTRCPLSAG